jgi:hypothetical protein
VVADKKPPRYLPVLRLTGELVINPGWREHHTPSSGSSVVDPGYVVRRLPNHSAPAPVRVDSSCASDAVPSFVSPSRVFLAGSIPTLACTRQVRAGQHTCQNASLGSPEQTQSVEEVERHNVDGVHHLVALLAHVEVVREHVVLIDEVPRPTGSRG